MSLPKIEDVDFTKAFTAEQQEEVNKLPANERYQYMERHNSSETMAQEERLKHYQSSNYPELRYGPNWTLTPPKTSRK